MTGPRPPYGGNPDDPTMRGYSQDPADATRRADLGDIATGKADALAWSHEGPQPGAAPTPNYGGDPYQQYPPYQQPQYEQPQYGQPQYQQPQYEQPAQYPQQPPAAPANKLPMGTIAIAGAVLVVVLLGGGLAYTLTGSSEQEQAPTAPQTVVPRQAPAVPAAPPSVAPPPALPRPRHPLRATTVRQAGRTPVARPRARRPAAPPARPQGPFRARQRGPSPVGLRVPRPASPRRPRAPRRGPRPEPKVRRREPRPGRRRAPRLEPRARRREPRRVRRLGPRGRPPGPRRVRPLVLQRVRPPGPRLARRPGRTTGSDHRDHDGYDDWYDDWHNDRWRRRPGVGDVQHRWVDDRHALPPRSAALLIRPACNQADSGCRPTGRRRGPSRARSRTPTGR